MSFNCNLIQEIRLKDSLERRDLANLLGITSHYLYMIEKGMRQPSTGIILQIAKIFDVSIEKLLCEESEPGGDEDIGRGVDIRPLIDLKKKLDRERHDRRSVEKRNLELEWALEHLTALVGLHVQFEDIMCRHTLALNEKMKMLEKLARTMAHEGEFTFSEMLTVFRVKRPVLKQWLDLGKRAYPCRLTEEKSVVAATPGEAALRLTCFDCAALESGECRGYGNEKRPENLILLLVRLAANGVYGRDEQSRLLEENYGIKLSPHEISVMVHRYKSGMAIPEGIFNLEATGSTR